MSILNFFSCPSSVRLMYQSPESDPEIFPVVLRCAIERMPLEWIRVMIWATSFPSLEVMLAKTRRWMPISFLMRPDLDEFCVTLSL